MTKQEAIERAWALLERLDALPDSVDVLTAEVTEYGVPHHLKIHLNSGIEAVRASTGKPIQEHTSEDSEYLHREILANDCEYVQLEGPEDRKATPGDDSTEGGKAA